MKVIKFGGSSLATAERIKAVSEIIKSLSSSEKDLIVVVSAVGGVTDMLLSAARELHESDCLQQCDVIRQKHLAIVRSLDIDPEIIIPLLDDLQKLLPKPHDLRTLDTVMSFGERLSSRILSAYLNRIGVDSSQHDAFDVGFVTNEKYGSAEILPETYQSIRESCTSCFGIPVITGFIAKTKAGNITTLGRGGSDYTAAIIGSALEVDEVQIWSDVDGIMTVDPRLIPTAQLLPTVTFQEASELAYFGAKVLHPKTIIPLMERNIPVLIKNTFNPDSPGTVIVSEIAEGDMSLHKAIAFKRDIQVINVRSLRMLNAHGFLEKVFRVFGQHQVVVDMIATSEVSVSVTVDPDVDLKPLVTDLQQFCRVKVETERSILCVVGTNTKYVYGVSAKVLGLLAQAKINVEMISQGANEINLGLVIHNNDLEAGVNVIHKGLFESDQ